MEDWEKEQANEFLDNEILEMLHSKALEFQERDHTAIVNPVKYAKAYRVITEIKKTVDGYLSQYIPETEDENYDDEGNYIDPHTYTAEYKEYLTGPVLSRGLCFQVKIPPMGVEFAYDDISRVFNIIPEWASVEVHPGFKSDKPDGTVVLEFSFPGIYSVSFDK